VSSDTINRGHYPLADYSSASPVAPVFRLEGSSRFSPLDVNLAYLARSGWNQAVDRLRFRTEQQNIPTNHPLAKAIGRFGAHLLIRRLRETRIDLSQYMLPLRAKS
jgi:hypothetical protein